MVVASVAPIFLSPLVPQGVPNNVRAQATNSNTAFQQQFTSGGTLASMTAAAPLFTPPNLNTNVGNTDVGRVGEWNLEVQKSFGSFDSRRP